jgi:PIN domain nuclease of toxin-antitoxin system
MRLLLDTHTFLWFLSDDAQLSDPARKLIEDGANEILLSMASLWEMAINSIGLLGITLAHTVAITTLPFHHRDPFDRLLVAQSMADSVPIVSRDTVLDAYGVVRMW